MSSVVSEWRATKQCTVDGCVGGKYSHGGFCNKHAHRMKRYGSLEVQGSKSRGSRSDNPYWSGDRVTYSGAHIRVRRIRGRVSTHVCGCGAQAQEWAYDHADENELVGVTAGREAPYSADPSHYVPMCRSCHRTSDRRRQ